MHVSTYHVSHFLVEFKPISITVNKPVKMTEEEAFKILGLPKDADRDKILQTFQRHFDANDPERGGSFYLQAKIYNAKEELVRVGKA